MSAADAAAVVDEGVSGGGIISTAAAAAAAAALPVVVAVAAEVSGGGLAAADAGTVRLSTARDMASAFLAPCFAMSSSAKSPNSPRSSTESSWSPCKEDDEDSTPPPTPSPLPPPLRGLHRSALKRERRLPRASTWRNAPLSTPGPAALGEASHAAATSTEGGNLDCVDDDEEDDEEDAAAPIDRVHSRLRAWPLPSESTERSDSEVRRRVRRSNGIAAEAEEVWGFAKELDFVATTAG